MVIKKKGRKGKKNRSTREERKREGTGQKCRLGRERKGKVEWRVTGQLADRPTRGQPSRGQAYSCLLYTSPSPRDRQKSRMPSSA